LGLDDLTLLPHKKLTNELDFFCLTCSVVFCETVAVTVSFSLTSVCVKSVLTGGSGRTTISSDNFFGVDDEGGNRLEVISAVVGISIEILVIFSIFSTVSVVVFSTSFNSIVFSGSGSGNFEVSIIIS